METIQQTFTINTTESEEEVRRAYAFATSVLGKPVSTPYTPDYYIDHFHKTPGLLVYAEKEGQVVGSTLGSIEEDHVLVEMVAVAANARRMGIGLAMMQRLEEEAKKLGQTTLILGSRQEAETFYLRCGFRPNLFVQLPEAGKLDELKQLGRQYPVIWESEEDAYSRLMLATPQIDRELQEVYQRQFPDCGTQYVFIKELS